MPMNWQNNSGMNWIPTHDHSDAAKCSTNWTVDSVVWDKNKNQSTQKHTNNFLLGKKTGEETFLKNM